MLRLVRETDEYTRLRQLQALAEAGCLLTGTIFIVGFLERFNVIGDVPLFLFGPGLLFLLWPRACPPAPWQDGLRRAMKNIIRALRTERGWSQQDLADQLDVSRQSVNAIETGKYDPSLPLAFALARLFGRSIEELFDDGSNMAEAAE
jgi:putative transcriptional regulator